MDSREELDFEIGFYEKILQDNPDFLDALIAIGDAYTKAGRYEDGLKIDRRLSELKPLDPMVHYNLACSYSLLKNADSCLDTLKKAIELGYDDFGFMEADSDLNFIREDRRYRELLFKNKKQDQ